MSPPWRTVLEGIEVALKVAPRAAWTAVAGLVHKADGSAWLQVRVSSPPVDGRANAALLTLLARMLRVPASACALVSGSTLRRKWVRVQGEQAALLAGLEAVVGGAGQAGS